MSQARFGAKWADVDEDEDEGLLGNDVGKATRFETPVDEHGIKTVIEYTERDGKTYKVSRKIKQTKVTSWTNKNIADRKSMSKFGKAATNDATSEAQLCVKSHEEVVIEVTKKLAVQAVKDDAEDKFYEDSLQFAANLNQEKKVWTDMNRIKQLDREETVGVGVGTSVRDAMEEGKEKTEGTGGAAETPAAGKGTSRYVPPSIRNQQESGKGDGKGKGKTDLAQQQEASLRVTNLSEDCREGDLQDLFGQCGRLQRVYLAKDMDTGLSRGFAFITYHTREDAQKAIDKLNGYGYDNLILQVQFAKPRT